jgi:hypothetical protein
MLSPALLCNGLPYAPQNCKEEIWNTLYIKEISITSSKDITGELFNSIAKFGRIISGLYLKITRSTTKTEIPQTIELKIWNAYLYLIIDVFTICRKRLIIKDASWDPDYLKERKEPGICSRVAKILNPKIQRCSGMNGKRKMSHA